MANMVIIGLSVLVGLLAVGLVLCVLNSMGVIDLQGMYNDMMGASARIPDDAIVTSMRPFGSVRPGEQLETISSVRPERRLGTIAATHDNGRHLMPLDTIASPWQPDLMPTSAMPALETIDVGDSNEIYAV